MITTAQEYFANLDILQNVNQPAYALLPSAENIYEIDINSRTISAPQFLSVEKDYRAETIYFSIDRYVDYMDLAQTCCVIQFNNASKNKGTRIYPVPFYDVYKLARQNKIIFPWCLDADVTETAGIVEFSIRFFKIGTAINKLGQAEKVLTYNLNTLPAQSKVLYGFQKQEFDIDEDGGENLDYYFHPSQYETLSNAIFALGNAQKLQWTVLDDSFVGTTIDPTGIQLQLEQILDRPETET